MSYFQKYQHVVPLNDLKEHNVTTHIRPKGHGLAYCDCECRPEHIELEGGGMVIVHNAYDGREGVEIVNRLLDK